MKYLILLYALIYWGIGMAQSIDNSELYKNYREDQFYASVTYNLLNSKPDGLSQSGFSTGFHIGFIRDMPINSDRDFAVGLGIGFSSNSYNQNLGITEEGKEIRFDILNENELNVSKNKFSTYLIEVPLELRWRTSTATDYNFWRIYTGFKLGYMIYNSTKLTSNIEDVKLYNIDAFNRFQYGLTLSVGYGTWNFHAYYGLNSIFNENARLDSDTLDMGIVRLGLMFYIL
ncbi:porin family protein [Winogradskyella alexanderae]|uniref:PorT family protein n=1 Tax=Winogradskyella alexanderae TaxID=2877123 RepID=A0ABS7XPR1_9FLAO|nr:porin family protein [Winogradskyella alexanderae]MCA0131016.1 PorT family protein [Winogradskyella alexanderae]